MPTTGTVTGAHDLAVVLDAVDNPASDEILSVKIELLTRSSILEHPLLAPRLTDIYDKARRLNTTLPESFETFVKGTLDGDRGSDFFVKGRVKWQNALMGGLHEARATAWQRSARKHDKDRIKEMAGE